MGYGLGLELGLWVGVMGLGYELLFGVMGYGL